MGTISGLYRYAYVEEILARDPSANVRRPKVPQGSTMLGLDRTELSRFMQSLDRNPTYTLAAFVGG